MQIYSLRLKSYKSWKVDDSPVSDVARERFKKLRHYWELKEQKCSMPSILSILEVSRATLYRWQNSFNEKGIVGLEPGSKAPIHKRKPQWSKQLEQQVLHLRKRYPLWGKKTLTTLLRREHKLEVSESTVGRIIKKLVNLGKLKPVCFYYGQVKAKKRRVFNKHARRWTRDLKARKAGEMIQVDHMTVTLDSQYTVKHFEATCPVTKITVSQSYTGASSKTAAHFLEYVKKQLPFTIKSIQVDGGSEFRKDFEDACEQDNIPLYVLPPRSPELNGCVERCNRTIRYEFYRLYDGIFNLDSIRKALKGYMQIYNSFRPHQALAQATPMEYYLKYYCEA